MFIKELILVGALVGVISAAGIGRNVAISHEDGSVNLVEFHIRDVLHGKCSFIDGGEQVELIYEEKIGGDLVARASNPTILDPVSKARQCRKAATLIPLKKRSYRSDVSEADETFHGIQQRLVHLQKQISSNHAYVDQLRPRFLGYGSNDDNGYLITIGNRNNNNNKPEVGFGLPFGGFQHFSVGGFSPFNFMNW